jgi:hypothetical protein
MSDDTPTRRLPDPEDAPTQRMPAPGNDAPTQRLDAPAAADSTPEPAPESELVGERKRSRALLITLLSVGGALIVAIIVLLVVLLSNGGGPLPTPTASDSPSPSPSATPSPTPTQSESPTPTPEPPPPSAEPTDEPEPPSPIVSYMASVTQVDCTSGDPVPVTFNWNTTGQSVTFGIGTDDADAAPYQTGLPAVGGITVDYQCGQPGDQQRYAIAVYHNGTVLERETIVIRE